MAVPVRLSEPFRRFVGENHIRRSPPLHIHGKVSHPAGFDIIGDQEPRSTHEGCQVGGFPPWRGSQIQNALSLFGTHQLSDRHG